MEATTREAVPAMTPTAVRGLPPGPRMPRALQTAIWSRQAQWMLEQSRARFGDMFTIRIANEGTWVMVSDPELVKQVFTGDPRVFHAGEGNQILRPILGDNSVLVLDEKPHIGQRRLLLPPFHGERMQGYGETMAAIAAREIESWPTGTPYKLRPRMQAITLEIILETVFGVHDKVRMDPLRAALRDFLDLTTDPRFLLPVLLIGPDRIRRIPAFRRRVDRVDELIYAEIADRRRAEDLAERDDILSVLVAACHEDGSPMSDAEIRDELADPAGRRPRDHRDRALLGGRAPRPPPGEARAPARRGPGRGRRALPDRDDPGDAAPAAGDRAGDPQTDRAGRARRLRARPPAPRSPPASTWSTATPRSTRAGPLPARALPRQPARHLHLDPLRRRRPPLPRRRLRPVRDGRRPRSWSSATRSAPANPKSERPFRRAITETPRHDAEVVLG